eukprot:681274-Karenia_brevis.AAC.1
MLDSFTQHGLCQEVVNDSKDRMTKELEKLFVPAHLPGTPMPIAPAAIASDSAGSVAATPGTYGPASKSTSETSGPYSASPAS